MITLHEKRRQVIDRGELWRGGTSGDGDLPGQAQRGGQFFHGPQKNRSWFDGFRWKVPGRVRSLVFTNVEGATIDVVRHASLP